MVNSHGNISATDKKVLLIVKTEQGYHPQLSGQTL